MKLKYSFAGLVLLSTAFGAFKEEIVFRAPLSLLGPLSCRWSSQIVIWAVVLISILFGYLHGDWTNILLQGGLGLIFSLVYLKMGGMRGRVLIPLLASSAVHFLYNGIFLVRDYFSFYEVLRLYKIF